MKFEGTKIHMGPVEQTAYFNLVRSGNSVATPRMLSDLLKIDAVRAARILFQLKEKGIARRIGLGKYVIRPPSTLPGTGKYIEDSYTVTLQLMAIEKREYAVAYAAAAYLHGLLEQVPMVVQVMVNRYRRSIKVDDLERIEFAIVSPWKMFGVTKIKHMGELLNITDVEKTILDCLDRVDLVGGLDNVVQILAWAGKDKMDGGKLVQYAKRMRNKFLIQRLGFLLTRGKLLPEARKALSSGMSFAPCPLDAHGPRSGRFDPTWQVWENAPVDFRRLS